MLDLLHRSVSRATVDGIERSKMQAFCALAVGWQQADPALLTLDTKIAFGYRGRMYDPVASEATAVL